MFDINRQLSNTYSYKKNAFHKVFEIDMVVYSSERNYIFTLIYIYRLINNNIAPDTKHEYK